MKKLKINLNKHRKDKNDLAWMIGVAEIHRFYNATLAECKEKTFQLKNRPAFADPTVNDLNVLAEELVEAQQKTVPKLEKLSQQQEEAIELYSEYETLKRERQKLLNQLSADRYDLKESLAVETSRLR